MHSQRECKPGIRKTWKKLGKAYAPQKGLQCTVGLCIIIIIIIINTIIMLLLILLYYFIIIIIIIIIIINKLFMHK